MYSNTILNTLNNKSFRFVFLCICFLWYSIGASAQKIDAQIDSLSIKIGQELSYKIEIEVDTSSLVVFPEGQTFMPLEMIESYQVVATKMKDRFKLVKEYGLTQFDSGTYNIPRQKVVIGDYEFFTDSLQVDVNNIIVDTTKQGLYDIKPIVQVSKSPSKWWLYSIVALILLGLVVLLLYWFIWKSKPLTEEEKAALLPPYERAKLALKVLDDSSYLQNNEIKAYYSDLTQIIRTYLDEKVYDRALESTTDELINRITLLREGNKIDLSKEDIKNIETILKRADLVKFAKSKPDIALAQLDRNTIDTELDQVRQALPEPTEEELLVDLKFQEALAKKRKKRRTMITVVSSLLLLVAVYVGLSLYFGFTYVNDTIVGNQSKQLLEAKEWVTSEYGAPGVTMTTPKTLVRDSSLVSEELENQKKVITFKYGNLNTTFEIEVRSSKFNPNEPQNQQLNTDEKNTNNTNNIDLLATAEEQLKQFDGSGVQNIITKNEQFITPNGQEGLKTFGTADFKIENTDQRVKANYIILGFTTDYLLQQVILKWKKEDSYSDDIVERIMGSIELLKLTEKDQ
jgi:hypothetical protein